MRHWDIIARFVAPTPRGRTAPCWHTHLPRYDWMAPRIAAELGRCQFVLIAFGKGRTVTEVLRSRLRAAQAGRPFRPKVGDGGEK